MASRTRQTAMTIKLDGVKELSESLTRVGLTLRSPEVTAEVQRGADVIAARVKLRAPVATGALRAGIYTASALRSGFVPLSRRGRPINSPLRYPPRQGQVVLVSSVFYSAFVDRGRAATSKRGRMRPRRFFRVGVQESRGIAESYIITRIQRLIESRWGKR